MKIVLLMLTSLFLFGPAYGQEQAAPVTTCDKLYVVENDKESVVTEQTQPFDLEAAYKACKQAVSKYPEEARLWLRVSHLAAQKHDKKETIVAFTKAAEYGSELGLWIAYNHYKAEGPLAYAMKWLKILAEMDDAYKIELANSFIEGNFLEKKPFEGINILLKLSEKGNAEARAYYGMAIANLGGTQDEFARAIKYLKEAYDTGFYGAGGILAEMYMTGKGVEKNTYKAVHLFREAFHKGDDNSAFRLGYHYYFGVEIDKNIVMAKHWLCKSELYLKTQSISNEFACE